MKLLDYIKSNRKGKQAHRTELDAMGDPLLHDAIEGLDAVEGDHGKIISRLQQRVMDSAAQADTGKIAALPSDPAKRGQTIKPTVKRQKLNVRYRLAAAAVIMLVVSIGSLLYMYRTTPGTTPPVAVTSTDSLHKDDSVKKQEPISAITGDTVHPVSPARVRNLPAEASPLAEVPDSAKDNDLPIRPEDGSLAHSPVGNFGRYQTSDAGLFEKMKYGSRSDGFYMSVPDDISIPPAPDSSALLQDALVGKIAGVSVTGERDNRGRDRATDAFARQATGRPAATANIIRGRVTDSNGEPLIGAAVVSSENGVVAMTDTKGNFELKGVSPQSELKVSYIGFDTYNITLQPGSDYLAVSMQESVNQLEEVVITGYGVQKKVSMTGSVSAVKSDELTESVPIILTEYQKQSARDKFTEYLEKEGYAQYDQKTGELISGSVTATFKVNELGRPYAIKLTDKVSSKIIKAARRLLRSGPDWPYTDERLSITFEFPTNTTKDENRD